MSSRDQRSSVTRISGIQITHPDKLWWPAEGITKSQAAQYYAAASPRMLPWLNQRPLTAERCPEGVNGTCFYVKNFAHGLPDNVPTRLIAAASTGQKVQYVIGGSATTLVALANLGCIAIHVMNCQVRSLDRPDWLTFDLDPSSGKFSDAAQAASVLRQILEELQLRSFPKTSGGRGLHILVPLQRQPDQETVRACAHYLSVELMKRAPKLVTNEMSKERRQGLVFADWVRNAFGQTIVAPYSLRRQPKAPISTPLHWDEISPQLDPTQFNLHTIESRLAKPEPWVDFWEHRQALPQLPEQTSTEATVPSVTPKRKRPNSGR